MKKYEQRVSMVRMPQANTTSLEIIALLGSQKGALLIISRKNLIFCYFTPDPTATLTGVAYSKELSRQPCGDKKK